MSLLGPGGVSWEHISRFDRAEHGMNTDLLGMSEEACLLLLLGLHMDQLPQLDWDKKSRLSAKLLKLHPTTTPFPSGKKKA